VLRKTVLGRQLIDLTGGNKRREVVYASGATVDIVIDGAPQEFEIDGEEMGLITAARFAIDPKALVVRVPEQAAARASAEAKQRADAAAAADEPPADEELDAELDEAELESAEAAAKEARATQPVTGELSTSEIAAADAGAATDAHPEPGADAGAGKRE
jgi:hypothetical protein